MMLRSCFQHLADIERHRIVMPLNVTMRLNRGEQPEPLPVEVRQAMLAELRSDTIQEYPSYQGFYQALSNYIGFPEDQIVVGAGIEEFIRTLTFLCCEPGEKFGVLWPTCAMYDIYALAFGAKLVPIITRPGETWQVNKLLSLLPTDLKILFLPNPGQPVETCFNLLQMRLIADWCKCHGVLFAVDEAHHGFGAPTALPLLLDFDNVVVLRTFSKFFAAASLRVGFVVGQKRIIAALHGCRPSGEIAGPSLTLANVLIKKAALMDERAREVAKARDWLRDEIITKLKLPAYGRYGFSVLIEFDLPEQAREVAEQLRFRGILVKVGFPHPLRHCMLVSCGGMNLMQKFYVALRDIRLRTSVGAA